MENGGRGRGRECAREWRGDSGLAAYHGWMITLMKALIDLGVSLERGRERKVIVAFQKSDSTDLEGDLSAFNIR